MRRLPLGVLLLALGCGLGTLLPGSIPAQQIDDRLVSAHVRIRLPMERGWLGRETIMELERCWQFVKGATGNMPRKVLVVITWDNAQTGSNYEDGSITIAMDQPSANADPKSFLLHAAGREMARLGLLELSRGGAAREESRFLLEGMSEILVHEYERNSRNLGGAWVIAHFLDRMKLLGLAQQSSEWSAFFGGRHSLKTAAPGITFLMTCRELHGRERLFKFFDSLKKSNLNQALSDTFKNRTAALESTWLQKVRDYDISQEITTTSAEDAPYLERIVSAPAAGRAGSALQMRLYLRDKSNDLMPETLFVQDTASGKVLQARVGSEGAARFMAVEVPIELERKPGQYETLVTAVDEAGNVRSWKQTYSVQP